jgi:hypothetical protein
MDVFIEAPLVVKLLAHVEASYGGMAIDRIDESIESIASPFVFN